MIGLFDRDVFYKLIVCDLLELALDAFGVTEPFRLFATSNENSNRRALAKKLHGQELEIAMTRVSHYVSTVPTLSDELALGITGTKVYQSLAEIDGIDDGELLLASILITAPEGRLLITGDKRFVKSLKLHSPEYWNITKNSIITFEKCVLKILEMQGFEEVRNRSFNTCKCDESLRLAFGEGTNEAEFFAGLTSFAQ